MSAYRFNNRFNPPLQTASARFPRVPVETPTTPANFTTPQQHGAPYPPVYTNQITNVPIPVISSLTSNINELTITTVVDFSYTTRGSDHLVFALMNSNTNVTTYKSFQQAASYTIGEFDPGTNYFISVAPVINGLQATSSISLEFLSSPATNPGIIQGAVLTGSDAYAIINFTSVYPSRPIATLVAVNDNFNDAQVLVNVTYNYTTNQYSPFTIGPYTDGSSYQFLITPVVSNVGGIFRYGQPTTVPATTYFIPGPPSTPFVSVISASGNTVSFSVSTDTAFHPIPDYYRVTSYTSTLSSLGTVTGISGTINDVSASYSGFTVSSTLITPAFLSSLRQAAVTSNLVADITNDLGLWYSFRVTDVGSNAKGYTFSNAYYVKSTDLSGASNFVVNFNYVLLQNSISSFVSTTPTTGSTFTICGVQTTSFTTFVVQTFANNEFCTGSEFATIWAGPPSAPVTANQISGNAFFQWTIRPGIGPRPVQYVFSNSTTNTFVNTTTISSIVIGGLTNHTTYNFSVYGLANNTQGSSTDSGLITPSILAPTSLQVSRISNTTVNLSIGRPLGGTLGYYVVSSLGQTISLADVSGQFVGATFNSGILTPGTSYNFTAYSVDETSTPLCNAALSSPVTPAVTVGSPAQITNLHGVYTVSGIWISLALTGTRAGGVIVTQYNISDNHGHHYSVPATSTYDLSFTFPLIKTYTVYDFTVTPFGNNVSGTVSDISFNFDPQPPTDAILYFTAGNTLTVSYNWAGPPLTNVLTDYFTIQSVLGPNLQLTTTATTDSQIVSPGIQYSFNVFVTVCGIISISYAQTNAAVSGPPLAPLPGITYGSDNLLFNIGAGKFNAVPIDSYTVTEYFLQNGTYVLTGQTYTTTVSLGPNAYASITVSGVVNSTVSALASASYWMETASNLPNFSYLPVVTGLTNPLQLNMFPNQVILTLSQNLSHITFPITTYSKNKTTGFYTYGTDIVAKSSNVLFNAGSPLMFTWKSGYGPFYGGTYRYDFQAHGNDSTSPITTLNAIAFFVGSPENPKVVVSNTQITLDFSQAPTSPPVDYYLITDNYNNFVTTTFSHKVFTNLTDGSAYSYTVIAFANGISSAPSQTTIPAIVGRPQAPSITASYNGTTATISSTINGIVPVTDVCLNIQGVTGYTVSIQNQQSVYASQGPTFIVTNCVSGNTYTFSISAFANQVYSTGSVSKTNYFGSLLPGGTGANIDKVSISNVTATVTLQRATATATQPQTPDSYIVIMSNTTTNNAYSITDTATADQATYSFTFPAGNTYDSVTFSGYTLTNNISAGSAWTDTTTYILGGPYNIASIVPIFGAPIANTLTGSINVDIGQGTFSDTSYYISICSGSVIVTPCAALPPVQLNSEAAVSVYVTTLSTGNSYTANVYGVRNLTNGTVFSSNFSINPATPLSPSITVLSQPTDTAITVVPGAPVLVNFAWTASPTLNVSYLFSTDGTTYVNIGTLLNITSSLSYGNTYNLYVQALKTPPTTDTLTSDTVVSLSAYIFTNPPTALVMSHFSNIVTLSWNTAFQPGVPSQLSFVAPNAPGNANIDSITLGSAGGGPIVYVGSNVLPAATFTLISNSVVNNAPILMTLCGEKTLFNYTFQITSVQNITDATHTYKLLNTYPLTSHPTIPDGETQLTMFITNPQALPSGGYTIYDLCGAGVIASNIYSNAYQWTNATIGCNYNLAVQAFNSNMYSVATDSSTGWFSLSTIPISPLNVTYFGTAITLSWVTPRQYDTIIPTTASPNYSWVITENGTGTITSTTANTTMVNSTGILGNTYTFAIDDTYYGISGAVVSGNQITLSTTPTSSVTQTTSGFGIIVNWMTALQPVYLPSDPNTLQNIPPNGGYTITDLCGNVETIMTTNTNLYISPLASNLTYNFAVTAIHNGIYSSSKAPGAIFLGVGPVTNVMTSMLGLTVTLSWSAPLSNIPNTGYVIYDANGNTFGDPTTQSLRTVTCNIPGTYGFTTLAPTTIITVSAAGGGGGGSSTFQNTALAAGGNGGACYTAYVQSGGIPVGTTLIATVGAGGAAGALTGANGGFGGGNSTVYMPYPIGNYPILDAGGGGGGSDIFYQQSVGVSGNGFVRGGVPDGGSSGGGAGTGSGGSPIVGGGGAGGTPGVKGGNGAVSVNLVAQTFVSTLTTPYTSLVFSINYNKNYNFRIVSYSNGLSSAVSVPLISSVVAPVPTSPTTLVTTFSGTTIINNWPSPSPLPPSGFLLINMLTGDYSNISSPAAISNVWGTPGVLGSTYSFSIDALSNNIPSLPNSSFPVQIFSYPPATFSATNNGTTILLSASGNSQQPLQTFTLTDSSNNVILSGINENALNVNFGGGIIGVAGSNYAYNLYGDYNNLPSTPLSATARLTIPGSTSLHTPPSLGAYNSTTSTYPLTITQCTPSADRFIVTPVNLQGTYYSDINLVSNWVSIAMSLNGSNILTANNSTATGANIFFSLNQGQTWTCNSNSLRIGYAALNVAIAANGTWGAVATTCGLWMTSNVSTLAPWFSVPAANNPSVVCLSPDGTGIVVGQGNGNIYYANTSNLNNFFNVNGTPLNAGWTALAWSGDGTTILATPVYGYIYYSTTSGQTWTSYGGDMSNHYWTGIATNSNASTVLAGTSGLLYVLNGNTGVWSFNTALAGNNAVWDGLAVSYQGDIVMACQKTVPNGTPTVFISYDGGCNFQTESRFNANGGAWNGAAISSNGWIESVAGNTARLQSIVNTPVSTGTPITAGINTTQSSINVNVPPGTSGYQVVPNLRNLPGPPEFVWITTGSAPVINDLGVNNVGTALAFSGWAVSNTYAVAYVSVVVSPGSTYTFTVPSHPTGIPNISVLTPTSQSAGIMLYATSTSDLPPGSYTVGVTAFKNGITSPSSTITFNVPPRPSTLAKPTVLDMTGILAFPLQWINVSNAFDFPQNYYNTIYVSNTTTTGYTIYADNLSNRPDGNVYSYGVSTSLNRTDYWYIIGNYLGLISLPPSVPTATGIGSNLTYGYGTTVTNDIIVANGLYASMYIDYAFVIGGGGAGGQGDDQGTCNAGGGGGGGYAYMAGIPIHNGPSISTIVFEAGAQGIASSINTTLVPGAGGGGGGSAIYFVNSSSVITMLIAAGGGGGGEDPYDPTGANAGGNGGGYSVASGGKGGNSGGGFGGGGGVGYYSPNPGVTYTVASSSNGQSGGSQFQHCGGCGGASGKPSTTNGTPLGPTDTPTTTQHSLFPTAFGSGAGGGPPGCAGGSALSYSTDTTLDASFDATITGYSNAGGGGGGGGILTVGYGSPFTSFVTRGGMGAPGYVEARIYRLTVV